MINTEIAKIAEDSTRPAGQALKAGLGGGVRGSEYKPHESGPACILILSPCRRRSRRRRVESLRDLCASSATLR